MPKHIDSEGCEVDNSVQSGKIFDASSRHHYALPDHVLEHPEVNLKTLSTVLASLILCPCLALGAQLPIAQISSNSVLKDKEKGIIYEPSNMLDQQSSTMWVEGEGSAGLGKYISVNFPTEVDLSQFRIWGGCFIDKDFWQRHNRVKALELKFPDFTSERVELKDVMEPQIISLKAAKKVSSVKIYLRDFYKGSTWNDTAITALEFFDSKGPEGYIEGLTATASSHYPDEDGAYTADKLVDGWFDTYWVNGTGSGADDHIDINLAKMRSLRRFAITVGNDTTESFFNGSNRARTVNLRFSDGSTQNFALADKPGVQEFDLSSVRTSSVQVTFSGIIMGASNSDFYVGELRFWE